MAMALNWQLYLSFCIFILISHLISLTEQKNTTCSLITSIYQIGDSTADTGNLIRVPTIGPTLPAARPPYGQTFPGQPTGRWSDGRLIIDYLAMRIGVPLLRPYMERNASFENGVNFAVAGATALDTSFLASRGVTVPAIITTLSGQVNWFRQFIASVCSIPTGCPGLFDKALMVVGDIGNNDINYGLGQGRTIQEITDYVPYIPQAIANATREIIGVGANKIIIVPGTFPLGCFPINLALFPNDAKDDLGCLININVLSQYFNGLLRIALIKLRLEFPNTEIIYADFYGAFRYLLRNGPALGFNRTTLLKACCGIGGEYNFDRNRSCGSPGVPVCSNPASYVSWDGNHLTQEAHRRITDYLLPDIVAPPKFGVIVP